MMMNPSLPVQGESGGDATSSTKFCLKWNNFGRNVTTSFKALLENEEFVDISLSAQGSTLKAHKVVLSASSQYFRDILQGISAWQHPVIVLRDVPFSDLQGIVEFIYHGEVSVDQECLSSFLKTAQLLRVKGLTEEATAVAAANAAAKEKQEEEIDDVEDEEEEEDDDEDEEEEEEEIHWSNPPQPPKSAAAGQMSNHHHPRKSANPKRAINQRKSTPQQHHQVRPQQQQRETDEESEPGIFAGEIDDREEEEIAAVQQHAAAVAAAAAANNILQHFMSAQPHPPNLHSNFGKAGGGSIKDEDEAAMVIDEDVRMSIADPASPIGLSHGKGPSGAANNGNLSQKKTCPYCFQQLSWHALSRHIRDMHRNKSGFVTCKFCGKMFRNKNSLGCHMWRFHKDNNGGGGKETTTTTKEEEASA